MALTLSQRARIRYVIDYLNAGSAGNIDSFSIEQLAIVFKDMCDFRCGCPGSFILGMQNSPASTLLKAMLCINAGALDAAQVEKINWITEYLDQGSAGAIDATSIDQLARVFCGFCDFRGGCPGELVTGLQNSMAATLLELILCVDGGFLAPGVGPGPAGDVDFLPCTNEGLALFGILGGSTVTNTGSSVINGWLGIFPGSSLTGFPPGVVVPPGETHVADAVAAAAQDELSAAYIDLQSRTGAISVSGNLGGQTLGPGLYQSTSSLSVSSGDLTLDAGGNPDAVWIFQVASTFVMTSGRAIILAGGALPANIFFAVGSSATLGSTAVFNGNILAQASITAVTGAAVNGRLLARTGAVTLDSNVLVTPPC